MSDWVAVTVLGMSLAMSVAALAVAIAYGRHQEVELIQPGARGAELRDQQRAAIDKLLEDQQRLTLRVLELELTVTELQLDNSRLRSLLHEAGIEPPSNPKLRTDGAPESLAVALYKLIAARFNVDELADLGMSIGIQNEDIAGETITARALELVQYAQRHGMLSELIAACRKARPKTAWPKV